MYSQTDALARIKGQLTFHVSSIYQIFEKLPQSYDSQFQGLGSVISPNSPVWLK